MRGCMLSQTVAAANLLKAGDTMTGTLVVPALSDDTPTPATLGFIRVGHATDVMIGMNQAGASNRSLINWGSAANNTLRLVADGDKLAIGGNVIIGGTVPTSPLQVVALPVYANNAAALAGGLTAGAFYRTNADPDPVCVVH